MKDPTKELWLWTKLSSAHPELTRDSSFGDVAWGSLEWTEFLAEVVGALPREKKDSAIRKLFLESDFEKLSFNGLVKIIHELEE